ncbi:hypothetical protein D3C86_2162840 [compost metagenome]
MITDFHHASVIEHDDFVRIANRGETMRYDEGCATGKERLECLLNFQLRICVDTCCRFIQNEHTRISEKRSSE